MIKTRYVIFILIGLTGFILSGCSKDRDILFDIPLQVEFEIPAGLSPFQTYFHLMTHVPTNIEPLKRQFNLPEDQSIRILPESAILTTPLGNQNFDFLAEFGISVYQGEDQDNDAEAFLSDQIPINAGRSVVIIPFNDDLSDYLDQPTVNLKIWYRPRAITPSFVDSRLVINFTAEKR